MPDKNRNYVRIVLIVAAQALIGIMAGMFFVATPRENIIFPGVLISGTEVGGLSRAEAAALIERRTAEKLRTGRVVFRYNQRQWPLTYQQLGVRYDIPATVENALRIGRDTQSQVESLVMFKIRGSSPELPYITAVNPGKARQALLGIAAEVDVDVQNAVAEVRDGRVLVKPEVIGKRVLINQNLDRIVGSLSQMQEEPVELAVAETKPGLTAAALQEIRDSLGVGVTPVERASTEAAVLNDAVGALNGRLLKPGEIFSFNQAVGPVINEKVYRQKPVTVSGQLAEISSGAASKAASTLYQAVLYSGMSVKERHIHLAQPDYGKLGQDAAVVYGHMDLKFQNDTGKPVYIMAYIKGSRLFVELLGIKKEGTTIQVVSKESLTQKIELTGPRGSHARVYRVYYRNGVEEKRELVSENDYK